MTTIHKLLIRALPLLLLVSCHREPGAETSRADSPVTDTHLAETPTLYCSIADEFTKTYIEGMCTYWTKGELLSVFQATGNQKARYDGETGTRDGEVTLLESPSGTALPVIYGVYPYSTDNSITADGVLTLNYQARQQYRKGSFGPEAAVMMAVTSSSSDFNLNFKNMCSCVVIKLYGIGTVTDITIRGKNGERLAGKATVDLSSGGTPSISMTDTATGDVKVTASEGVRVGVSEDTATEFWICLPPVEFTNGFDIIIKGAKGRTETRIVPGNRKLEINKVYRFAPIQIMLEENALARKGFTVDDDGKTVTFAPGNLYWDGSAFAFEKRQYDFPSEWNGNHVGHFYWSLSAEAAISENFSEEYVTFGARKTGTDVFFASNGGAVPGYTVLTKDEWKYLTDRALARNSSGGNVIRIDGVNCTVLKPNGFTGKVADSYTASEWSIAESYDGLVALPFAGARDGASIESVGVQAFLWSGTTRDDAHRYYVNARSDGASIQDNDCTRGYCVRPVKIQTWGDDSPKDEFIFTVSLFGEPDRKYIISPGNLYWNGSSFAFEEHPWECPEEWTEDHVSLFSFASSAEVAIAEKYPSVCPENNTTCLDPIFASDGGVIEGYTNLDKSDWYYLVAQHAARNSQSKSLFMIEGRACFVLTPDGFKGYVKDSYTAEEWEVAEKKHGLAALPLHTLYSPDYEGSGYWCRKTAQSDPTYCKYHAPQMTYTAHPSQADNVSCYNNYKFDDTLRSWKQYIRLVKIVE